MLEGEGIGAHGILVRSARVGGLASLALVGEGGTSQSDPLSEGQVTVGMMMVPLWLGGEGTLMLCEVEGLLPPLYGVYWEERENRKKRELW